MRAGNPLRGALSCAAAWLARKSTKAATGNTLILHILILHILILQGFAGIPQANATRRRFASDNGIKSAFQFQPAEERHPILYLSAVVYYFRFCFVNGSALRKCS
jgi:hypothetical protein